MPEPPRSPSSRRCRSGTRCLPWVPRRVDAGRPDGSAAEAVMAMQKISVLRGSLSDIGLVELLQVISAGRQYMAVELEEGEGRVLGALLLKSGMLLDARTRSE